MLVIPATQEAEIRGLVNRSQAEQIAARPDLKKKKKSKKTQHK
jgi:hypothetical protein